MSPVGYQMQGDKPYFQNNEESLDCSKTNPYEVEA